MATGHLFLINGVVEISGPIRLDLRKVGLDTSECSTFRVQSLLLHPVVGYRVLEKSLAWHGSKASDSRTVAQPAFLRQSDGRCVTPSCAGPLRIRKLPSNVPAGCEAFQKGLMYARTSLCHACGR